MHYIENIMSKQLIGAALTVLTQGHSYLIITLSQILLKVFIRIWSLDDFMCVTKSYLLGQAIYFTGHISFNMDHRQVLLISFQISLPATYLYNPYFIPNI